MYIGIHVYIYKHMYIYIYIMHIHIYTHVQTNHTSSPLYQLQHSRSQAAVAGAAMHGMHREEDHISSKRCAVSQNQLQD